MNFLWVIKLEFIVCNSKKDYSTNGLLSLLHGKGVMRWCEESAGKKVND